MRGPRGAAPAAPAAPHTCVLFPLAAHAAATACPGQLPRCQMCPLTLHPSARTALRRCGTSSDRARHCRAGGGATATPAGPLAPRRRLAGALPNPPPFHPPCSHLWPCATRAQRPQPRAPARAGALPEPRHSRARLPSRRPWAPHASPMPRDVEQSRHAPPLARPRCAPAHHPPAPWPSAPPATRTHHPSPALPRRRGHAFAPGAASPPFACSPPKGLAHRALLRRRPAPSPLCSHPLLPRLHAAHSNLGAPRAHAACPGRAAPLPPALHCGMPAFRAPPARRAGAPWPGA